MGKELDPKNFRPHMVASFSGPQLKSIVEWYRKNVNFQDGQDFNVILNEALERAGLWINTARK